jgi:hypothetical protein
MVYLVGVIGFIAGFFAGQTLLVYLLRDSGISNKELLEDKALRFKYGMMNWLISVLGALMFVWIYKRYFF